MTNEQRYLLYLINCAVKGEHAKHPDFDIDWTAFSKYIEEQQFEHIMYPLFKDQKPDMDPKVWHHLHQRYGRSVVRDTNQDLALAEICEAFSEAGIAHMPLKGSVVKRYYPLPELRYSGDFDILVHEEDMERASAILIENGFTCGSKGIGAHDIFARDKLHIELHHSLVHDYNISYDFCRTVWDYSEAEDGCTCSMSDEFLYVYMLIHLRKHILYSGGAGIKLILDIYIMRKELNLDKDILNEFLRSAKIEYFNECMVKLEQKWFEGIDCDEENVLITEEIILNSGAYADYGRYLNMLMSDEDEDKFRQNKAKRFIGYLFPPARVLKGKYKVLEKHPYLLPVMWIARFATAKREKAAAVAKSFKSIHEDEAVKLNRYINNMSK